MSKLLAWYQLSENKVGNIHACVYKLLACCEMLKNVKIYRKKNIKRNVTFSRYGLKM